MISVVFPAYNEEENIRELHRRLVEVLRTFGEPFEIIAVDNASVDRTRDELLKVAPVKIISLAYNIGQSAGLDAGIHAAKGDVIVTIDADLQNDPADIPRMFAKMKEGYDAVLGWRKERHDSFGRRAFSFFANWLTRKILKVSLHDYACSLKMFRKEFIRGIHLYGEMHVFLGAILHFRGARIAEIPVSHCPRKHGLSKHTFLKGLKDLADLVTVRFLMSTSRPLIFYGGLGVGSFFVGGIAIVLAVILKILKVRDLAQTPLPVIASFFIISGLILVMMGILAEFILRVYYEGRRETPYLIREVIERT